MARLGRLFLPGYPALILQRGNNGASIFHDEPDCQQFLSALREAAREASVAIHAYVLMPDHLHLLASASEEGALGGMMQRIGRRYVRWFNDRYQRRGTLWEGRYRSTAVEASRYALACYRYIEMNPVRRRLVQDPASYPWSSCRHHLGLVADPLITDHACYWATGNTPFERQSAYRSALEAGESADVLAAIRYAGHAGWLLGEPPSGMDTSGVRRAKPLPKGRPARRLESSSD